MGAVSSTHPRRKSPLPPRRGLIKAQIFESFADNAAYLVGVVVTKMKEYDRCARCYALQAFPGATIPLKELSKLLPPIFLRSQNRPCSWLSNL